MKNLKLSLLIAGFVTVLASFLFVACEKKSGTNGDSSSYSIVGTWVSDFSDYYGDSYTYILKLNKNNTGTFTIKERSYGYITVYDLKYNYDPSTCTGSAMLTYKDYEYNRTYTQEMEYKIKWYGENTIAFYTRDAEDYYEYEEWELMGTTFERQ